MKKLFIWLVLLIAGQKIIAQDSVATRIILIGDGGQFTGGIHPVSDAIRQSIPLDKKTIVIFLGDNVYKVGLPDDQVITYAIAHNVLDSQVSIVANTEARLYMIPGNHDWNNGSFNGIQTILREQSYVNQLGKDNVRFYPEGGCPGPVEVSLSDDVVLIVIDTQWWLHPYDKPGIESDCPFKTKDEVLTELGDLLGKNFKKLVIIATHHPMRSNGVHGGLFGIKQHIFPFTDMKKNLYIPMPVLGSIYPIARGVFGTPQDLKHPDYANMIHDIQEVTKTHPNVIFAAGHEHNLQLLKDTGYYYIVSGAGSKTSRVNKSRRSLFVSANTGFATLEISKNKNVRASFYTVTDSLRKPFSENILNFSKLPEIKEPPPIRKEDAKFKDTVNVAGSEKYKDPSPIQKWVIGSNYRKEWGTLVNMRVFHIQEEKGGLKVTGVGGGKNSKSLKLIDPKGGEWTLRTVDKDPAKAVPEIYRNAIGEEIILDLGSAAHPYGAAVVPELAAALGVVVAKPEYLFVPDDPALGIYRPLFANSVCMLESQNPTPDGSDSKSTGKLLQKMVEDNDQRADQKAVLTARLLDMLIADWDRHFDQWKWGTRDTGRGKIFYPIPKDRDQALAYSDGFLVKYASSNTLPFLKGFQKTIPKINWLNWAARDFDRAFLNQLSFNEWKEVVEKFQERLTDSVLNKAVGSFPPAIYAEDKNTIKDKLKNRRDLMMKRAMKYYHFLSHYVNIVGSNKPEYFRISTETDGRLKVSVYERRNNMDTAYRLYSRTFDHKDTKELRLYGLNGNDLFETDESVSSKIKIRIIGGRGNDTFDIKGHVPTVLYDLDSAANYVVHKSKTRLALSSQPDVNDFNWIENEYTDVRFPRFRPSYNDDDGLFMSAGYQRKTYGFRKKPFSTLNQFRFTYAFKRAFKLNYKGEFNHVFKTNDLVLRADLVDHSLDNFFGFGNNTVIDKSKSISYYQAFYKYAEASLLVRKRFFDKLDISVGPYFYRYWIDPKNTQGKVLQYPSLISLDSMGVYNKKTYLGAKLTIDVHNINNELFPTRGIQWLTELSFLSGISGKANSITKLTSDMVVYASFNSPTKFVTVLRLGGGRIFGNKFEYFQAFNLGADNYLRGYRKDRFSGSSRTYANLEVRLKLLTSKWYLLPGDLGLLGFDDIGKVGVKNLSSRTWHNSFGGGLYFVPYNMMIISAIVAFSNEDRMLNISTGAKVNITF
jgi:hypothetical protein